MAAPSGYPSWAYNSAGQSAQIVLSLTAFNALGGPGTWSSTPFGTTLPVPSAPFDPNFQITDIRLQQQLIEQRVTNYMLSQMAGNIAEDVVLTIRADILANDASITS